MRFMLSARLRSKQNTQLGKIHTQKTSSISINMPCIQEIHKRVLLSHRRINLKILLKIQKKMKNNILNMTRFVIETPISTTFITPRTFLLWNTPMTGHTDETLCANSFVKYPKVQKNLDIK